MKTGPHDRNDDFMTHEPPELQRLQGHERDREITLNMGTILGIFFGLVLVCAVFFGMGYTLGRRSSQPQVTADGAPADSNFNGFKPSPQSVAIQPVPGYLSSSAAAAANNAATTTVSAPAAPAASESAKPAATASVAEAETTKPVVATTTPAKPPTAAPIVSAPPAPAAAAPAQPSIVQVSAVSHQEDADLLVSSLKKRGYAVYARSDAGDKLIHIQLGPFPNRAEANAMRQRLLGDGYNAIVK